MQRAGEKRTDDQINQGADACIPHQDIVEDNLHNDIDKMDPGEGELVDHHWTNGIKEDLKGAEECLPEDRIEEERFECRGKVCIYPVDAEGFMMG